MSASNSASIAKAIAFGIASVALYALLFAYAEETVDLARRTREGETALFLVPIVVAFVFSIVHGAFTGQFWAAVGLRPAVGKKK